MKRLFQFLKEARLYLFIAGPVAYTFVYLIVCFIEWDFLNPFQWVIDIPTYNNEERGILLFFWATYWFGALTVIRMVVDGKKDNQ